MPEATPNYAVVPRETLEAVRSAFDGGDAPVPESASPPSIEDVHRFVAGRIAALLDGRRDLLFSILYRIDVAEEHVMTVLAEAEPAEIPSKLADLVIRRQLQKLEIRRRYAGADPNSASWLRDEEE
ncbi:MAG TPA: hypothetical protein VF190_01580 [Rhodothermales bacterium]